MSVPWAKRCLGSFRVARLPFLIGCVTLGALDYYLHKKLGFDLNSDQRFPGRLAGVIWFSVIIFQVFVFLYFLLLPRLRDIEMNQAWVLLILVPGVNLFLLLVLFFRRSAMGSGDAF